MRGFFNALGFDMIGVKKTPENPELKLEMERYEKLKKSLKDLEDAAEEFKSKCESFSKSIEALGNALSDSMLWSDGNCKDLKIFRLTSQKKEIMSKTLLKQMDEIIKGISQKNSYIKAIDKGLATHKKVKSKHDHIIHRIHALKEKIRKGREDELAHIIDANMLDTHIQRKFHREFQDVRALEKQRDDHHIPELKSSTHAMVAALRSTHNQIHRYCEATSIGLEKAFRNYISFSHSHVKEEEKEETKKHTKIRKNGNRNGTKEMFKYSTSDLRKMHSNDSVLSDADSTITTTKSSRSSFSREKPPIRPPRRDMAPRSPHENRTRRSIRLSPVKNEKNNEEFRMSTSSLRRKHSHEMYVPESYDLYGDPKMHQKDTSMLKSSPPLSESETFTPTPTPPPRVSSSHHNELRIEMAEAAKCGDYDRAAEIQETLEKMEKADRKKKRRDSAHKGRELFLQNIMTFDDDDDDDDDDDQV